MIAVNVLEWQKFTSEDSVCYVKGEFKNSLLSKTYEFQTDSTTIKNINLMQFTGLTDKNGKEIYEGDIVKQITGDAEDETYISEGIIEYLGCGFSLKIKDKTYVSIRNFGDNLEVIGNIYENPDLLSPRK